MKPLPLTKNVVIAAWLMSLVLSPVSAKAGLISHPFDAVNSKKGDWVLDTTYRFLGGTSRFAYNGAETVVAGVNYVYDMDLDGLVRYGLSDSWTLFGRLTGNAKFDSTPTRSRQNIWMGDQLLGANLRIIKSSPVLVSAQIQLELPTYDNSTAAAQNFPFNGDQTVNATLGGFADYLFNEEWSAHVGTGLMLRSGGYPTALPYIVEARYQPALGFRFKLGATGIASFGNPSSLSLCSNGDSGLCYVASPSPTLLTLNLGVGLALESGTVITASCSLGVFGVMAPKATGFTVGLTLPLNRGGTESAPPPETSTKPYRAANQGFVGYDIQAKVISVNDRLHFLKIDKGSEDGVEVGNFFDIFSVRKDGSIIEAVARARVESVRESETALKITEYFKEVWIDAGFIAKRPLH